MSDNIKAIIFAAVLSIICCLLITAACTGLKKFQLANEALDRQINIVKAVGLIDENTKYAKAQINQLYTKNIVKAWADSSGRISLKKPEDKKQLLELYFLNIKKKPGAIIIPINIRGLWGRISGYLAVNQDGKTIRGFTVTSHAETPGLGGEIESRWFRQNFSGKELLDKKNRLVSVSVAKGKAKNSIPPDKLSYYVDGISGATLTGNYLTSGIKETLIRYEKILKKLRTTGTIL